MKKLLLIILLFLVAAAAGVYFYLRSNKLTDFEPLIKSKLTNFVKDASGGLYHLEMEKLEVNVLTSTITLINVRLSPDTLVYAQMEKLQTAPNDIFDVSISQLALDDIVPAAFLTNRSINLHRIFINKPIVKVWHKKQPYNVKADSSKTVFQQIKKDISSVKVDTVIFENIDFIHINKNLKYKETRLSNVKLYFSDILIDSSTQFDQDRFLFAKNCLINVKDYKITTADKLYGFTLGEVQINTSMHAIRLNGIKFEPMLSEKQFYQRVKHQQDMFDLSIQEITFRSINWWAILAEEAFDSNNITTRKGNIKVYNDKSQPEDMRSKVGKYPQQLLMELPFKVDIDSLQINDFDVSYTELNPKSGQKGILTFNDVNGWLTNITNDPDQLKKNAKLKLSAKAKFLNRAPLTAVFDFDLVKYKTGNFTVTASLGALDHATLNKITVPLAMVSIKSLEVKSIDLSLRGDNNNGSGTVKLVYSDLSIDALKNDDDGLKKRGLLSFVANRFIIKKDNPLYGKEVRIGKAAFKRVPNKSFFNLVWKTTFTGAAETVGFKAK